MESSLLLAVTLNPVAVAFFLFALLMGLIGLLMLLYHVWSNTIKLFDETMRLYHMIEAQKTRINKAEEKLGYGRPRINTNRPVNGERF